LTAFSRRRLKLLLLRGQSSPPARIVGRTTLAAAALASGLALVGPVGVDAAPATAAECAAATITAPVVADTWLDEESPLAAKGSDPDLSVEAGSTGETGVVTGRARALLRFALPEAIPPGCVVTSARLSLHSAGEQIGARVEAVPLAAPWTESATTWTTQPAALGEAAQAWSREGVMRWNVTAHVQAMLGGADHGFLIRDAAEGAEAGGEHSFHSRENGEAGTAATLRIEFGAPGAGGPPGPPLPPSPAAVGCGEVLTRSTLVTNDLADCPGDGLVVGAPRIIVDLGGHTIDGTGLGAGIRNDGHADVTVRNGTVQEFDHGVLLLPEASGNLVEHLGLRLNQLAAVELFDVAGAEIRSNSLAENGSGISLVSGTRESVVADNSITASGGGGLLVRDSWDNVLEWNAVIGGGDVGIGLERASGNLLLGNSVFGNSDGGIEVRFGSHENRIEGNSIAVSGDHGILVSESDGNELVGNAAHDMSDSGITLDTADESVVRGNDVQHNAGGLQLDGSSRNLLAENDASDTSGIGIELGGGSLANVVEGNRADDNGADGIVVADEATVGDGNLLRANTADRNGADGIVVAKGGHTVTANVTHGNLGWGINAALGTTIDGGGNVASGNGKPAQCAGVACAAMGAAPETFITDGPDDPTNETVAAFVFVAAGAVGFECALDDDDDFSPCVSPASYGELADGRHAFRVRSLGGGGSVEATPAVHTWTVDTGPPETTMTDAPAATTTSTTASFAFTATEPGSSFECALDEAAFTACTSPQTHTSLAAGGHRFRVRAVDAAGNVDPTPATVLWTIAAPAPPLPPPPLPPGGGGGGSGTGGDADLVTSLAASAAAVAAGGAVTVTVTVSNRGGLAENVTVTLTLSPNAAVAASSSDRGPGCGSGGPLVCNLDFLGPPGTIRLTLAVAAGGPVVVGAAARARQSDANPADNDATLTIPASPAAPVAPPARVPPTVRPTLRTGTARADVLRGTPGRDLLRGLGGRDVLHGLGGQDTLVGGTGVDRLLGGAGNDTLVARDRTRDTISCGSGRDVVHADPDDRVARDCEQVVRRRAPR
jgi:large repetitive protein